jgi:hypothetical protein
MGREVKRVQLDFDWPLKKVWPGYMGGICEDDMIYCLGKDVPHEKRCEECRHAARLAGIKIQSFGCPNWKHDPLPGDGWQMWETTSEGSPISPVFDSPENLARWLADTRASSFGSDTATYEQWLAMVLEGWAPSMIIQNGNLMSGVQFTAENPKGKA